MSGGFDVLLFDNYFKWHEQDLVTLRNVLGGVDSSLILAVINQLKL